MDFLTEKLQVRLYMLLPLALSLAGALRCSWVLFALSALSVVVLALLPMCAEHESLWIFLAVLPASVPVNVFLTRRLASCRIFAGFAEGWLEGALWLVFAFLTLLSIEELAFLQLSRMIWPVQHGDEMMQKWIAEDEKTRRDKRK